MHSVEVAFEGGECWPFPNLVRVLQQPLVVLRSSKGSQQMMREMTATLQCAVLSCMLWKVRYSISSFHLGWVYLDIDLVSPNEPSGEL